MTFDPKANLILHWPLEELFGTTAADHSETGNQGTVASLTFDADSEVHEGKRGLTRVSGADSVAGNAPGLGDVDQTWGGMFRTSTETIGQYLVLLSTRDGTANASLSMGLQPADNRVFCWVGATQQDYGDISTSVIDMNDGDWHTYFIVYDQSEGTLTYYLNGSEVHSNSSISGAGIGADTVGVEAFVHPFFSGTSPCSLRDLRIYNTALSASDVSDLHDHMTNGATPFPRLDELRGRLKRDGGVVVDELTFDPDSEDWNDTLSNCTISEERTEMWDGETPCIRVTYTGETFGAIRHEMASDWVMGTGVGTPTHDGIVEVLLPNGIDAFAGTNYLAIRVIDSSANTAYAYLSLPNTQRGAGWFALPWIPEDFVDYTTIDWSAISKITIEPNWSANAYGEHIILGRVKTFAKPDKARLFIRFDDGKSAAYGYANALAAEGLVCSLAIVMDLIDVGTYLTSAELAALRADGHFILNHLSDIGGETGTPGWVDDTDTGIYTTLADRVADIEKNANEMAVAGYGKYRRHVVVPGGSTNPGNTQDEYDAELIRQNVSDYLWYAGSGGPNGGQGYNGSSFQTWPVGQHEWMLGANYNMDGESTANCQAAIQNAIDRKTSLTIYGHASLVDWATTVAFIKSEVDAGNLEVVGADYFAHGLDDGPAIARDAASDVVTDVCQDIAG